MIVAAIVTATAGPAPSASEVVNQPTPPEFAVEKSVEGDGAALLFVGEVQAHIEDGYAVAGIAHGDRGVELLFAGAETVLVRAEVDADGNVVAVEISSRPMSAPTPSSWLSHEVASDLDDVMGSIALAVEPTDAGPTLTIRDDRGKVASIGLGAVMDHEICGG